MPKVVLESPVTASIEISDEDGKQLERLGKGILVLSDEGMIGFVRKKLLGGYEPELNHSYNVSEIVKTKDYADGLDIEVYFSATEEEPAEVVTYFYELKRETSRWLEAISSREVKKTASSETQREQAQRVVIKEREVIREIVKVRCRHCGNLYDERQDRCPHCGGR